jgi:hypothetical protein
MSLVKKYLEEKAHKSKMAEADKSVDELDTDDYKLDKNGKKHKASKLVFNKGEDDGKQIGEELKGSQHKIDKNKNGKVDAHDFKLLRKEEEVDEAKFDALKFIDKKNQTPDIKAAAKLVKPTSYADRAALMKAGKVKDDRGPRGVTQEEVEQIEFTVEDIENFMQTEEYEQLDELSKSTLKSYKKKATSQVMTAFNRDPSDYYTQKMADKMDRRADHIGTAAEKLDKIKKMKKKMKEEVEELDELSKKTLNSYSDAAHKDFSKNFQHDQNFTGVHSALRTAMAKTNSGTGGFNPLKGRNKNPLRKDDAVQAGLKTAADAVTAARAPFKHKMKVRNQGMHRAAARLNKEEVEMENGVTGMKKNFKSFVEKYGKDRAENTMKESSESWRKDQEAKAEREARAAVGPKDSATVDKIRAMMAKEKADKMKKTNESVFDWRNSPMQTKDKNTTSTYHDVKKISTGTVYTKQFDKDGTSKGTGDDAAKKAVGAEKRGRGRPKKDKFAEAVEFLMDLTEEQFDTVVEEGFDLFVESFLEEGKTGYAPGWMIKADPELKKKIDANKAKQKAMRQSLGNPAAGKSEPRSK